MMRFAAVLALAATLGAIPAQLDSQLVLQRYELELSDLAAPKAMIFSYAVSQAGPANMEQRHRIYRSGQDVRDETLAIDGATLSRKLVTFGRREDRYAPARLAPRSTTYSFVFLRTVRDGTHRDYEYEVAPLLASATAFSVDRVTIDGQRFLPRSIRFHTESAQARGTGELQYGPAGGHWVPFSVNVTALVRGKPARERITFGDYRFPPALPASTFVPPKVLPAPTLPPI